MGTNYDELSGKQINKRIAMLTGLKESPVSDMMYGDGLVVYPHSNEVNFDPCNAFEDWYPIAEKYGMSMDVGGGASIPKSVSGLDSIISHTCEGKLGRAVSICFLKLMDATND